MHRIGLLLFPDVDLLDVGGPYEVFLTADRLVKRAGGTPPFEVVTVGTPNTSVTAYGGLGLVADATPATVGTLDVLVVPGTIDIDRAAARADLTDAIVALADATALVTTVCTGSVLLARTGWLDGIASATTHHEDLAPLEAAIGPAAIGARWVDAGDVVTAGGLSSGIAMALHLVERLVDRDLALATAAQLAYDWDPDDGVVTATS